MYETKKGDNLSTIAKSNYTTVQGLLKANPNISNPNLIKIGQKINIGSQTPIAQQVASNIQSNVPNTVNAQAIDNVSPIKVPVVPQNTPTTLQTAKDTVSTLPQKESVQQSNDNVVRSLYQRGVTDPNQIIDVINYDQNGNKVSNLTLDDVFRVTDTIKVDSAKSKSDELLKAIGGNSQNNELNLIDLRSQYNVDTKKQELSDIQKKIADRTAQYEKAFIDTEGQVIPIEDIQGQKALVKRQMESEMAAYSAKAQVLQNDVASAESTVRDFMQARSADVKDYSDRLKMLYADAKDTLNESQKRIVERATKEADRKYAGEQKNLDFITEQALLAQKNGAPADLVAKVMQSKTRDEASKLVGKFSRDPLEVASKQLEMKLKQAQISKVYNEIKNDAVKAEILKVQSALEKGTNYVPSPYNAQTGKAQPVAQIASLVLNNKIKTNEKLTTAIGVIQSLQNLAERNPDKNFVGLAPLRLTPKVFASQKARSNQTDVDALKLQVEQWASGASLTESQTKSVLNLVPKKSDVNSQVVNKMNALADYMMGSVAANAASQGVNFVPEKIDFFKTLTAQDLEKMIPQTGNNTGGSNSDFFNNL